MQPVVLTIAGSDSSGGAGILADARAIHACGGRAATAITAVTAQNDAEVAATFELPAEMVEMQIDAVFDGGPVAAVKTGMLANAAIVRAVAASLRAHGARGRPIVVDPALAATSGRALLTDDGLVALREELLPLATVATPNRAEAERLFGRPVRDVAGMRDAAAAIAALGGRAVVVKGGHVDGPEAVDVLFDGRTFHEFAGPRIDAPRVRGAGCTFSAALATFLALGSPLTDAVRRAKEHTAKVMQI